MATVTGIEPIQDLDDLNRNIFVPEEQFEKFLQEDDWTWHQIARGEVPPPFFSVGEYQLACISSTPLLWVPAFLREPEDPDHHDPYNLWDYQQESIIYTGHTMHKTAAEVGKSREIIAYGLFKANTVPGGSGLIGAPLQSHLDEIIEGMDDQCTWNPILGKLRWHKRHKDGWKKHPHHAFYFRNGFKIDFKPAGDKGVSFRGVHARDFGIIDEAAKLKNKKQWSEFWRAIKPGCICKIYTVPDGDRSCDSYKLSQRAKGTKKAEEVQIESVKDASGYVKNIKFKLFHWAKSLMPHPYWSPERKQFWIEQYNGEDSPEYKHNVLGEDGDPENPVFPWHQFGPCIKDIPEYRALKVLVNSTRNEVSVTGYKCEVVPGDDGPVPRQINLLDEEFNASQFFNNPDKGESEFRRLIKSYFISMPGLTRIGADLGYSGDPTEIIVKLILGKKERMVARLQLKHVTYDQQCQALDAMDDVYGPMESNILGTDFGNAGSAVAHDLQGLTQYLHKNYDDRLKGFMFGSTTDNIDEDGEPIIEAKSGEPSKITLKEMATDILVKKMQRLELEYPPDPDIVFAYPNHTVRDSKDAERRSRVFKKEDDHIIDADRVQELSKLFQQEVEDIFA